MNDKIAQHLKELIDSNGPDYLGKEPYKVFESLLENKLASTKEASQLAYIFLTGVHQEVVPGSTLEEVSKKIQSSCDLNKKASDRLATTLLQLYSPGNTESWREKDLAGLTAFMQKKAYFAWEGESTWDGGSVTVDASYEAEIELKPTTGITKNEGLEKLLAKNPFTTEDEINKYFENELCIYLDIEFEDYCTSDDYYPPLAEDFEIKYYVEEWCKKNGFSLVSVDGEGSTGDYEPKHRGRW